MKSAALYLCHYNITERLVQTQVIAYLRDLALIRSGRHLEGVGPTYWLADDPR
jgi:hypothetical protein